MREIEETITELLAIIDKIKKIVDEREEWIDTEIQEDVCIAKYLLTRVQKKIRSLTLGGEDL